MSLRSPVSSRAYAAYKLDGRTFEPNRCCLAHFESRDENFNAKEFVLVMSCIRPVQIDVRQMLRGQKTNNTTPRCRILGDTKYKYIGYE